MTQDETRLDPLAVCTLPPAGLEDRLAWIRAEILPHAVATERSAGGIAFELEDAPGLAGKLDQLVALEADCCSSVVFEHRASAALDRRRLEVRGIDPEAAVFAGLEGEAAGRQRLGARLARAAGFGTLASLLVCCVLPIAGAALLGATAAASLASLDQPWVIAAAALLFGSAAFAWERRRRVP